MMHKLYKIRFMNLLKIMSLFDISWILLLGLIVAILMIKKADTFIFMRTVLDLYCSRCLNARVALAFG